LVAVAKACKTKPGDQQWRDRYLPATRMPGTAGPIQFEVKIEDRKLISAFRFLLFQPTTINFSSGADNGAGAGPVANARSAVPF
jgi:hypothetical protein